MNKEPETYEELIRMKKCVDLTKYYELTQEELNLIYNFLTTNKNGVIKANKNSITLMIGNDASTAQVINSRCRTATIDGLVMSNLTFNVISHYTPSSGGGGRSSGGSSSNNNNNNNNNNVLNVYTSSKKKNSEKKSKEIKLDIKDDSDNSSIKETNSHPNKLVLKDSSIRILNKESMKEESKVENIDEDNFKEKNKNKKDILKIKNEEERQSTVEIKDENDDMEYYIFILDNNGNMNMYKNKKNITLFNLYNVKGIDESYKEKKFFSVGYPYYFVLNELYFAITTDYGLFVTSNSNKEF